MIVQSLVVGVVVTVCSLYATWTLIPGAARRAIAQALLKLPLHDVVAQRLRKHAVAASGCGCDGCDRSTAPRPNADAVKPVTFHPPAPRRRD